MARQSGTRQTSGRSLQVRRCQTGGRATHHFSNLTKSNDGRKRWSRILRTRLSESRGTAFGIFAVLGTVRRGIRSGARLMLRLAAAHIALPQRPR